MTKDLDLTREAFVAEDRSNEEVYFYLLRGNTVTLGFVRNRLDDWKTVLRDHAVAPAVSLTTGNVSEGKLTVYPIWEDETAKVTQEGNVLSFADLKYGICFRLEEK
jgi:hypothetical protein